MDLYAWTRTAGSKFALARMRIQTLSELSEFKRRHRSLVDIQASARRRTILQEMA
jgi:hypothetical protein